MVANVYIHGSIRKLGTWSVCLVGKFICLSSLLFALHDRSRIFATDWLNGFYGCGKLVEL
jgi:hypothetical protein